MSEPTILRDLIGGEWRTPKAFGARGEWGMANGGRAAEDAGTGRREDAERGRGGGRGDAGMPGETSICVQLCWSDTRKVKLVAESGGSLRRAE